MEKNGQFKTKMDSGIRLYESPHPPGEMGTRRDQRAAMIFGGQRAWLSNQGLESVRNP